MAVASEPIARVARLEEAGRSSLRAGIGCLIMAAGLTALVIGAFGWEFGDVLVGTLAGTALWGVGMYLWQWRNVVPRGEIMEAPPGIEPTWSPLRARDLVLALPLFAVLAWLANEWDLGAVFIPGQMCGYAAAELVAYSQIRRWERAHGRRVLIDPQCQNPRPYAGAPL